MSKDIILFSHQMETIVFIIYPSNVFKSDVEEFKKLFILHCGIRLFSNFQLRHPGNSLSL